MTCFGIFLFYQPRSDKIIFKNTEQKIILTTIDSVSDYETEGSGLVRGTTVRTKNMFVGFFRSLKFIVGGELKGCTEMMNDARLEATNRMIENAEELCTDAILGVRYSTSGISDGASEILVYGTAVKLRRK